MQSTSFLNTIQVDTESVLAFFISEILNIAKARRMKNECVELGPFEKILLVGAVAFYRGTSTCDGIKSSV
jgi:hypothetical protein